MHNKLSKVLKIVFCASLLLIIGGCGNKTVITNEKFISIAEKEKYKTLDAIDQFAEIDFVKSATLAYTDDYSEKIEFYTLDSTTNAESMYNTNKTLFEEKKTDNSKYSEVNLKNYSTYTLEADSGYYYLCRVDNTFLYVIASKDNKESVKEFVKKLGY